MLSESERSAIDYSGAFRVAAIQRRKPASKAAIRFPVAAPGMAEAARFANETIPKLLPGLTDGTVILRDIESKEQWTWELHRAARAGADR